MVRYFSLLLLFILCGFSLVAQEDPIRKELIKLIHYETTIQFDRTPGFIVAMVERDTSFVFAFGKRSLEDTEPISREDRFEIGGITKLFTALIAGQLITSHQLDLKHSVNFYLNISNPALDSISILQLMTHTSGLPKFPPGWGDYEKDTDDPFANFNDNDAIHFLKNIQLKQAGPQEYLYSHLNYVVLQLIINKLTGKSFEELLFQQFISDSLLASTLIETTLPGYGFDLKLKKPWSGHTYAGSVMVKASLNDLILYCHRTLNGDPDYSNLLRVYPMKTGKTEGWAGLGWQVMPISKNRFVFAHTGRTGGHHSFVGLLPDTQTAVIVLSNSAQGTDPLGMSILNMMNQNWKRK